MGSTPFLLLVIPIASVLPTSTTLLHCLVLDHPRNTMSYSSKFSALNVHIALIAVTVLMAHASFDSKNAPPKINVKLNSDFEKQFKVGDMVKCRCRCPIHNHSDGDYSHATVEGFVADGRPIIAWEDIPAILNNNCSPESTIHVE